MTRKKPGPSEAEIAALLFKFKKSNPVEVADPEQLINVATWVGAAAKAEEILQARDNKDILNFCVYLEEQELHPYVIYRLIDIAIGKGRLLTAAGGGRRKSSKLNDKWIAMVVKAWMQNKNSGSPITKEKFGDDWSSKLEKKHSVKITPETISKSWLRGR